jgi:hypothetical protein
MPSETRSNPRSIDAARARALRAARAVSLGLAIASAGCAASVAPLDDAAPGLAADGARASDGAQAAAPADATPPDDVADAGESCRGLTGEALAACCDQVNWDPRRGCAAWGPLVPPALDARADESEVAS